VSPTCAATKRGAWTPELSIHPPQAQQHHSLAVLGEELVEGGQRVTHRTDWLVNRVLAPNICYKADVPGRI
jgi:hypothetical protein